MLLHIDVVVRSKAKAKERATRYAAGWFGVRPECISTRIERAELYEVDEVYSGEELVRSDASFRVELLAFEAHLATCACEVFTSVENELL